MARYFGDGDRFGIKLTHVIEETPRGSAGAVKNAEQYLHGTFLVLNGDIFHNRDFTDMLAFHKRNGARATIDLAPVEDPTQYGMVDTDTSGKVRRFIEKPKREEVTTNLINAGTWVIDPEVLQRIPPGVKCSFEREIFPGLVRDGEPVFAYPSHRYWMDTGTPEKYLQLHRDLLTGKCEGYTFKRDVNIGKSSRVHQGVELKGRIIIGEGCEIKPGVKISGPVVIGDRCQVGRDAEIADSVIWDGVTIGAGVEMNGCVIANDCVIGADSRLWDVILGDHINLPSGSSPERSARFFPEGET
jgi:mannose-1-phosphate guanylyltransferase